MSLTGSFVQGFGVLKPIFSRLIIDGASKEDHNTIVMKQEHKQIRAHQVPFGI